MSLAPARGHDWMPSCRFGASPGPTVTRPRVAVPWRLLSRSRMTCACAASSSGTMSASLNARRPGRLSRNAGSVLVPTLQPGCLAGSDENYLVYGGSGTREFSVSLNSDGVVLEPLIAIMSLL